MNTVGKMTLAGAVGMLLGYMAAAALPSSAQPQNLHDCRWQASKRTTDMGVQLANRVCLDKFPVAKPAASKPWERYRNAPNDTAP